MSGEREAESLSSDSGEITPLDLNTIGGTDTVLSTTSTTSTSTTTASAVIPSSSTADNTENNGYINIGNSRNGGKIDGTGTPKQRLRTRKEQILQRIRELELELEKEQETAEAAEAILNLHNPSEHFNVGVQLQSPYPYVSSVPSSYVMTQPSLNFVSQNVLPQHVNSSAQGQTTQFVSQNVLPQHVNSAQSQFIPQNVLPQHVNSSAQGQTTQFVSQNVLPQHVNSAQSQFIPQNVLPQYVNVAQSSQSQNFVPRSILNQDYVPSPQSNVFYSNSQTKFAQPVNIRPQSSLLPPSNYDLINSLSNVMNMPKIEYMHFDGNPVNYVSFMHNFEQCLERQNSDPSRCLQLLIQHCVGNAREAIESCVNLEPTVGYYTAKETLAEHFGKPHIIAKAHMSRLENLPFIKFANSTNLLEFTRKLEDSYRCLCNRNMGNDYSSDLDHSVMLRTLNKKLPKSLQLKWTELAGRIFDTGGRPKFLDFLRFIKERAKLVNNEYGEDLNSYTSTGNVSTNYYSNNRRSLPSGSNLNVKGPPVMNRPLSTLATTASTSSGFKGFDPSKREDVKCDVCKENHYIWKCEKFTSMSDLDKINFVKERELCIKCLRSGHFASICPKYRFRCQVKGCGRNHNTLLHNVEFDILKSNNTSVKQIDNKPSISGGSNRSVSCSSSIVEIGAGNGQVSLGVLPVRVTVGDASFVTLALLDTGSEVSLIVEDLVSHVVSKQVSDGLILTGVSGSVNVQSHRVGLTVSNLDSSKNSVELNNVRTVDKLPINRSCVPLASQIKKYSHLRDVPYTDLPYTEIGMIIGLLEKPYIFVPVESRIGMENEPIALKYHLGWVILGPVGDYKDKSNYSVNFLSLNTAVDNSSLDKGLERLWITDFSSGTSLNTCMSLEDKRAINIIESSLTRVDDHFQVALPWRNEPPFLPNNKSMVEQRMRSLKNRLIKNPDLREKYSAAMQDYIISGHAELVPETEINIDNKPLWYLPHHPVIHPLKPDKIRPVFDCAAVYGGTSLNQQLLQGPDLTNKLLGVLIRFREGNIGIVADIQAMFHQVLVDPKDINVFRFLWWKNSLEDEPVEYRMKKHIFGATSSPCIANYCLKEAANLYKDEFDPEILHTVSNNMYVDDLMKSVKDLSTATKLVDGLPKLLTRSGFHLTKWASNEPLVTSLVPEIERAKSLSVVPVLGLGWDTKSDMFVWRVPGKLVNFSQVVTRRSILSAVASLFDPIGFIAPFVMKGKLILQMTSRRKLGWDDPLEEVDVQQWIRWLQDMDGLTHIQVLRCYFPQDFGSVVDIQLHIFSDGSRVGYSSVAYLRSTNSIGKVCCSFLMGKARLAPLKEISIPRLELSAATLSVKLKSFIMEELDCNIDSVTFWTDSLSVLKCICNESRRFHTFESNRLTVIHEHSKPTEWRWVNRDNNPADDGSKGLKLSSVLRNNRWLNGPEFLKLPENNWPKMVEIPVLEEDDPEVRKEAKIYATVNNNESNLLHDYIKYFSSWTKLKVSIAWLLRCKSFLLNKVRSKKNEENLQKWSNGLSLTELKTAESEVLKIVQKEVFPDVIAALESERSIKSTSIRRLNPLLLNGLLCVGGRLKHAPIPDNRKYPIILPHKHHVTDMIIRYTHITVGHFGQESVLAESRKTYWLIKGRSAVRRIIRTCITCQRIKKKPETQFMANLPASRLTPDRPPFSLVGIDFFGPFTVKQGRSTVKRYGCIFSCFNSKAIHVEIANTLNTDSCINALRRFISLRGYPDEIFSDNGSNFTSADKELRKEIKELDHSKLNKFCNSKQIIWHFNPPAASHMGGLWERAIRSVRQVLKSILKEQLVNDEVLSTVVAEAVYIINSRPLTRNSEDVDDLSPLTPNHLLHFRPTCDFPIGTFVKEDLYLKRMWRQAQYLSNIFWKRWLAEYMPTLTGRSKWQIPKRNVKVNDLVLIVDNNFPRGQWPLARVIEVIKSSDGFVRSVKLQTRSTVATYAKNKQANVFQNSTVILIRPITKICLLELD